ncbi:MAG: NUDIX hydrolase [Candidatus Dadabacteria bacterium]|nr:NUDIX hydrolase [Candidatus Dadabacteria bacterium]MCY4262859.1 NUDIX hydrolase [Candidatus Dadabacteria bacterium]
MPEKWKLQKSTTLNDYRIFSTKKKTTVSPKDGTIHDFYVVDPPDWVNIIAVTPAGKIVMIKQFRHGTDEITFEIPGGMIDSGETPAECARRELLEETGFTSTQWKQIGCVRPNPAFISNSCFTFLASGCERTSETSFDTTEDIETLLVSPPEIKQHIREGVIDHCIVIAAFGFYFHWEKSY